MIIHTWQRQWQRQLGRFHQRPGPKPSPHLPRPRRSRCRRQPFRPRRRVGHGQQVLHCDLAVVAALLHDVLRPCGSGNSSNVRAVEGPEARRCDEVGGWAQKQTTRHTRRTLTVAAEREENMSTSASTESCAAMVAGFCGQGNGTGRQAAASRGRAGGVWSSTEPRAAPARKSVISARHQRPGRSPGAQVGTPETKRSSGAGGTAGAPSSLFHLCGAWEGGRRAVRAAAQR